MITHGKVLSMVDHMDKMDQMDKEKISALNKSREQKVSTMSMKAMEEVYQTLYKAPYYEVGFESKGQFRRRLVKKNIELVKWVLGLRDKYPLYILSHGHPTPKDARELNNETFITNKIFMDFDGENLKLVKDEVSRFVDMFSGKYGGKPFVNFSGKKGYHVYLFLPEHEENIKVSSNTITLLLKHLQHEFNLEYLDESVVNGPLRLARAPYTYHQDTGFFVEPLNIETSPSQGLIPLLKVLNKKALEEEVFKKNNLLAKQKQAMASSSNEDKIENWNVTDKIIQSFYETGKHVSGTKHIVCCPFHADDHPSAFYDDKVFHCSACSVTVGSYRLLTELMGKSKAEALGIIKGFQ
jgi:hypothetical protein